MRITHVVENLNRGGLERVVIDLALAQKAAGHDCRVVCLFEEGLLAGELRARASRSMRAARAPVSIRRAHGACVRFFARTAARSSIRTTSSRTRTPRSRRAESACAGFSTRATAAASRRRAECASCSIRSRCAGRIASWRSARPRDEISPSTIACPPPSSPSCRTASMSSASSRHRRRLIARLQICSASNPPSRSSVSSDGSTGRRICRR